ncbi:MAG: bifunctional histidinol-phosphatase/imidazoleglycerol-phosphate dehydratase HisB [Bacteroidales bacterium]
MKKVLFIDRDGTLIVEPPADYQVDTLEKLEFMPGVFRALYNIRENLDYELVIVTNQDGLGTDNYPEGDYLKVQQKMLKAFENEGVVFDDILVDRSLPGENLPTRKPGTGLLKKYMSGEYDLANSWVIGDRMTDVKLAYNLGAGGILLGENSRWEDVKKASLEQTCMLVSESWEEISRFLLLPGRKAEVKRKTSETDIEIALIIDGNGKADIQSGLGFFDHMLEQIARHSGCDLYIRVNGDLYRDEHHTIEDTGLALGRAFLEALGNKRGIGRYGFFLPMDDSAVLAGLDFGGRSWLNWEADFKREKIGDVPTEMFPHFFHSFCEEAKCNLYIKAKGKNEHHKIEAIFKAFARSLKMAVKREALNYELPTTKGLL